MLTRDVGRANALQEATLLYASQVEAVAPYLAARGIGLETAMDFKLGYVLEPYSTEHQNYQGRLSIPYLTRAGVYTIRFRTLANSTAKYLSIPNVTMPLYNVNDLFKESETLVVTEGELDALVCSETLGTPAVGCPGASGWRDYFARCVRDYTSVVVVGDGDEAGRAFSRAVADSLPNGRAVVLREGDDVNSMVMSDGPYLTLQALGLV